MRLIPFKNKTGNKTDEQLLALFGKSPDHDIMGALYGRYMHLVYGVCLKYFKDQERAKDEVMNLYEKVFEALKSTQVKNFKSWLYVVVKNHCLMELRKARPGETLNIDDENVLAAFMENDPGMHPLDDENTNFKEQNLQGCIEQLKTEQRQSILLFYFENKSYREISAAMKLEEKKVKSLIQNGKRNLKICLETKS